MSVAPVDAVELSLVERISKIEDSLKDLKRAARQELKARRRRRGVKVGEKVVKGETPQQLKAWHVEVRKVWDEMRSADNKTPYKRAVAEASARRKNTGLPVPVAAAPKAKKVKAAAPVEAPTPVVEAPAPKAKKVVKKSA
jgi:hypothetical protein